MEITVHARNTTVDEVVRETAVDKLGHAARVFENALSDIDVEFSEEHNPRLAAERFRIEVTTSGAGQTIRIVSAAASPEAALDLAVDRFDRQLKRLKERLIGRNRRSGHKESEAGGGAATEVEIVRIKQFVMKPMTVEEAELQMDLLGHDFFFFHNVASGKQSVLYRRRDGRLGLIEPA
jgi:putative sigma-54 modulation protein